MENESIKTLLSEIIEDQQQSVIANGEMIAILKTIAANTEEIKRQKGAVDLLPNTNIMAGPSYISVLSLFYILC